MLRRKKKEQRESAPPPPEPPSTPEPAVDLTAYPAPPPAKPIPTPPASPAPEPSPAPPAPDEVEETPSAIALAQQALSQEQQDEEHERIGRALSSSLKQNEKEGTPFKMKQKREAEERAEYCKSQQESEELSRAMRAAHAERNAALQKEKREMRRSNVEAIKAAKAYQLEKDKEYAASQKERTELSSALKAQRKADNKGIRKQTITAKRANQEAVQAGRLEQDRKDLSFAENARENAKMQSELKETRDLKDEELRRELQETMRSNQNAVTAVKEQQSSTDQEYDVTQREGAELAHELKVYKTAQDGALQKEQQDMKRSNQAAVRAGKARQRASERAHAKNDRQNAELHTKMAQAHRDNDTAAAMDQQQLRQARGEARTSERRQLQDANDEKAKLEENKIAAEKSRAYQKQQAMQERKIESEMRQSKIEGIMTKKLVS